MEIGNGTAIKRRGLSKTQPSKSEIKMLAKFYWIENKPDLKVSCIFNPINSIDQGLLLAIFFMKHSQYQKVDKLNFTQCLLNL